MSRELVTLRKVSNVLPIEGADKIEVVMIDGWEVVAQKGVFWPGAWAIYFEIDSFVPQVVAPYLTRPGKAPKVFRDIVGERLKTIRLRGQLSQGLCLPVSRGSLAGDGQGYYDTDTTNNMNGAVYVFDLVEGTDLTELFGVIQYETQEGDSGEDTTFPHGIPKTSLPRVQNIVRNIISANESDERFERTEKLDGASAQFGAVCTEADGWKALTFSRNVDLSNAWAESDPFWRVANRDNIHEKLIKYGLEVVLQGELVGPTLGRLTRQTYRLEQPEFFCYSIWDIRKGAWLLPEERYEMCTRLGVKHVPIIEMNTPLPANVGEILANAEGYSFLNVGIEREGDVYKSLTRNTFKFKVISNKFLENN
jgi:RNA ligase (TIGR02306 family)